MKATKYLFYMPLLSYVCTRDQEQDCIIPSHSYAPYIFFFHFWKFNWSIVDLQRCVNLCCIISLSRFGSSVLPVKIFWNLTPPANLCTGLSPLHVNTNLSGMLSSSSLLPPPLSWNKAENWALYQAKKSPSLACQGLCPLRVSSFQTLPSWPPGIQETPQQILQICSDTDDTWK